MTTPPLKPEDLLPSGSGPGDRPEINPDKIPSAEQYAIQCAKLLNEYQCGDILIFDLRGVSPITSFIVIASGTSDRQIKALGKHVANLGEEVGFERFGSDADDATTWLALDFVEVMVHLFEPNARAHYDLEMLWGDAPKIDWA